MLDLEVVHLLWSMDVRLKGIQNPELQHSYKVVDYFVYTACLLVFALPSHLAPPPTPSPRQHTYFYLHPLRLLREENDLLYVSPVPLCLLSDRGRSWQADSWRPLLSPVISSHLLYCVSQQSSQPVWTLTGYFGLKFQHPSVKPNKHYLKGQQKPREKAKTTSGQPILSSE